MEQEVITIPDQASIAEAARQFLAHRIKRLIVVDAEGRLAGLLDRRAVFQRLVGATGAGSDHTPPRHVEP
jgi:predicted transcriptional regulator